MYETIDSHFVIGRWMEWNRNKDCQFRLIFRFEFLFLSENKKLTRKIDFQQKTYISFDLKTEQTFGSHGLVKRVMIFQKII